MDVFNGTAHDIRIIDKSVVTYCEPDGKYYSEINKVLDNIIQTIPITKTLSAEIDCKHVDGIIYKKIVTNIDLPPDSYDIYIVSHQYASIYYNVVCGNVYTPRKLYTICDTVYDVFYKNVLGCLGIVGQYEIECLKL